jgi:hypothetical protein
MRLLLRCLNLLALTALVLALALGPLPGRAILAAAPAAPLADFDVNSHGDDSDADLGDNVCETATADECTLRAAIEQANALVGGDDITFSITGVITLTSGLPVMTETLSIEGPGAGLLTIDGVNSSPVFSFDADDPATAFAVSGLTLGDGYSTYGGGIYKLGQASLVISDTMILENGATNAGGGIYHEGPVTIINSTIWDNQAVVVGAGIFSDGPAEIIGSTVLENRIQGFALQAPTGFSLAGGGIYALEELTLTNSSVLSNTIFPPVATDQSTAPEGCGPSTQGASPSGGPPPPRGYGIFLASANAYISNSDISFNGPLVTCAGNSPVGVSSGPSGGGVYNYAGQVTVFDSSVTHNAAVLGGGLFNDGGQMQIIDSVVADNFALSGGGGLAFSGGSLNLTSSQVVDNQTAADGGGLVLGPGLVLIQDSGIHRNEATGAGGGVSVADGTATVTILRSLISQNTAGAVLPKVQAAQPQGLTFDLGGGLSIVNSAQVTIATTAIYSNAAQLGGGVANNGLLLMTDVTLSGNRADLNGGGLFGGESGGASLRHVTFAFNIADDDNNSTGDGGGLYIVTDTTTLTNTLVAMNLDKGAEAPECRGILLSGGYNLIQSTGGGCNFTPTTGDQVDVVGANLLPLGNYGGGTLTHALELDSLAVNTAGAAGCTPADQRGVPRPAGSACDIGAFELAFRILLPLVNR